MEIIADIGHNQAWNIASGIYRLFMMYFSVYDVLTELIVGKYVGGARGQWWGIGVGYL